MRPVGMKISNKPFCKKTIIDECGYIIDKAKSNIDKVVNINVLMWWSNGTYAFLIDIESLQCEQLWNGKQGGFPVIYESETILAIDWNGFCKKAKGTFKIYDKNGAESLSINLTQDESNYFSNIGI
jgi:hypothetical protein